MDFKQPKYGRHQPTNRNDSQQKFKKSLEDNDSTCSSRETLEQFFDESEPWTRIRNHLHQTNTPHKSSITLHIMQLDLDISFYILKDIVIGRIDIQSSFVPDLNLADLPLSVEGISRKHIKLLYTDDLWQVEDLQSRNGSWLNNKRLTPHNVYVLADDDLLQLADIEIKIKLSNLPQD